MTYVKCTVGDLTSFQSGYRLFTGSGTVNPYGKWDADTDTFTCSLCKANEELVEGVVFTR